MNSRFAAEARRCVALPLGGVGAGHVALAGDGSLRQWQLQHVPNHRAYVPGSFFALRVSRLEPPLHVRRILQAPPVGGGAAPGVDDHEAPPGLDEPMASWPPVRETTLSVAYPFGRVAYGDPELPVDVTLEAHTPFVPLDAEASGMPLAVFAFTLRNPGPHPVHGWLLATLRNAVGWDGVTPFHGSRCSLLGGNVNRLARRRETTAIVMDNPALADDDPRAGEMALWTSDACLPLPRFAETADALRFADTLKLLWPSQSGDFSEPAVRAAVADRHGTGPVGPSPAGTTWGGGLALPFALGPGGEARLEVVHAWWFPNRVVNFDQFGPERGGARSRLWLGCGYGARYSGALDVIDDFATRREELEAASRSWAAATSGSTLPAEVRELLDVQTAHVRSPTFLVTADGRCFGFEGTLGASTRNWNGDTGGSCALTCTHVFNYEQALSRLFPSLARTMREVELDHVQAPDGSLPHRVVLPLWAPQLHGVPIGGPLEPALDGMLGAVLKTYREARQGAGLDWLAPRWPNLERLVEHVTRTWDVQGDGVLRGRQPVTYDIALTGANAFIGGLWLAALRAMEEMSRRLGASGGEQYRGRFETAREHYEQLFNGEYYAQARTGADYDFGDGCLSDQLLGQWWAHQLELGHIFAPDHVKQALTAVLRHNLRRGFRGADPEGRVFADGDDTGLVLCTWPRGGRPEIPLRYADEVWTGVEYQVAAHCIEEGLVREGLDLVEAVRRRYDGTRRNPYNHIECGNHYVRTLAGWTVLEALTGFRYDALAARVSVRAGAGRFPFVAGTGWGTIAVDEDGTVKLTLSGGALQLDELVVRRTGGDDRSCRIDEALRAGARLEVTPSALYPSSSRSAPSSKG